MVPSAHIDCFTLIRCYPRCCRRHGLPLSSFFSIVLVSTLPTDYRIIFSCRLSRAFDRVSFPSRVHVDYLSNKQLLQFCARTISFFLPSPARKDEPKSRNYNSLNREKVFQVQLNEVCICNAALWLGPLDCSKAAAVKFG